MMLLLLPVVLLVKRILLPPYFVFIAYEVETGRLRKYTATTVERLPDQTRRRRKEMRADILIPQFQTNTMGIPVSSAFPVRPPAGTKSHFRLLTNVRD